jgi:hypothetical protein
MPLKLRIIAETRFIAQQLCACAPFFAKRAIRFVFLALLIVARDANSTAANCPVAMKVSCR